MTRTALAVLRRNPRGYVLVVEGGLIDFAHHRGYASRALNETLAMDDAVRAAVEMTSAHDTLVVVTSDHSHTLSISGYPDRGANVLGLAGKSKVDGIPYTTLSYATGDHNAINWTMGLNGTVHRANPTQYDYQGFHYHQQAAVLQEEATHGGGDVAVYAKGPMAHLFHSLHEQSYVAHVIMYAAQLGLQHDKGHLSANAAANQVEITAAITLALAATFILCR